MKKAVNFEIIPREHLKLFVRLGVLQEFENNILHVVSTRPNTNRVEIRRSRNNQTTISQRRMMVEFGNSSFFFLQFHFIPEATCFIRVELNSCNFTHMLRCYELFSHITIVPVWKNNRHQIVSKIELTDDPQYHVVVHSRSLGGLVRSTV
jgi:hypothetical protein